MNEKESIKAELKSMQELIEKIEQEWNEGRINSDGDHVIPEQSGSRIAMLLEC